LPGEDGAEEEAEERRAIADKRLGAAEHPLAHRAPPEDRIVPAGVVEEAS
jgi:hypothetical protein